MSEQNAERSEQAVGPIGLVRPLDASAPPTAPAPDETWHFGQVLKEDAEGRPVHEATAWVYHGEGNDGLVRPVLLADGFDSGHSSLDGLYDGLERGDYAFLGELRRRGRDVILLGWGDRSASLLRNARFASEAILRAVAERRGGEPLVVGGFSMGGLVTRYALAKLEHQRIDHQTATYFSWDTPHRGAWVPIALQAFAHYLKQVNPYNKALSDQINSPASKQMLWRHIDTVQATAEAATEREEFLAELDRVGGWPQRPRRLAVANGRGDGSGNGVAAGAPALRSTGLVFPRTALHTQQEGSGAVVAELHALLGEDATVSTDDLPEFDGAPGGTLSSFGIAAAALNALPLASADAPVPTICFVPAVSAVSVRDLDTTELLHTDIGKTDPEESDFDDYLCASENEPHTKITRELGEWLIERF
ncbi:esterase/lipase family protein [Streptomyces sp. NPDC058374]|uniref:esterase/lipase family protein n=1 Tax=unclassified Streptomyces TaxID=2593676 RepID=UPI0036583B0D